MRRPLGGVLIGALFVLIWLADTLTPTDLAFSVFYLVPVAMAAFAFGRGWGIVAALIGAALWAAAEILARPVVPMWIQLWNGFSRAFIFGALAILVDLLVSERGKLRAIDRQREEALSFVAHELQTSVESIETGVPSLLNIESLEADQRRTLIALVRQAHSLKRFADDVLAVNTLEQGTVELERRVFDLGDLVAQATREASEPQRIQLVLSSDAVMVSADPRRLRLAVDHLVSNALKYSPAGSEVFVRVSEAEGTATVDVRDEGVGLSETDRGALFRKYGRVRNTRTARVLGVGLGLYVTRLLVEAHGGVVRVRSVGPSLGSTFTIALPLAVTPQGHEAARTSRGPAAVSG